MFLKNIYIYIHIYILIVTVLVFLYDNQIYHTLQCAQGNSQNVSYIKKYEEFSMHNAFFNLRVLFQPRTCLGKLSQAFSTVVIYEK